MGDIKNYSGIGKYFKNISQDYDSYDMITIIKNLVLWRQKFPKAYCVNISGYIFSDEIYNRKFLRNLKGITIVNAKASTLPDVLLEFFVDVKKINIIGCSSIVGYGIPKLKKLETLKLSECNFEDGLDESYLEDLIPEIAQCQFFSYCGNSCSCYHKE